MSDDIAKALGGVFRELANIARDEESQTLNNITKMAGEIADLCSQLAASQSECERLRNSLSKAERERDEAMRQLRARDAARVFSESAMID